MHGSGSTARFETVRGAAIAAPGGFDSPAPPPGFPQRQGSLGLVLRLSGIPANPLVARGDPYMAANSRRGSVLANGLLRMSKRLLESVRVSLSLTRAHSSLRSWTASST